MADSKGQPPTFEATPNAQELPRYSADRPSGSSARLEQLFTLKNDKDRTWLTLKVTSSAPSLKSIPLFFDGDNVAGLVEVDLDKPESAKAISVTVRGENTAVGQEPQPFLDVTNQLWSGSKLSGKQSWSFSITLPRETQVAELPKGKTSAYPLPPSFSERASPAYLDYKIIVTVKRGAFRVNQTLSTSFGYMPRLRAPAPSELRKLAYMEGSPLIGPDGDPGGWKILPAVLMKGSFFESKEIELEYTLAVAAPLTYATGSPVPLLVTLKCADETALDLLAKPAAIPVYLTRSIAIGSEAHVEGAPRRSNNTFTENVGKAFFWPATEGAPEEGVRRLHGELEIKRGTKVSFVFPRFTMRYFLSVHPPTAPGFASTAAPGEAMLSEKITIMNENAPGVKPRSHAPPGYVHEDTGNYNNSVGYLENGNQRFYHHHPGF